MGDAQLVGVGHGAGAVLDGGGAGGTSRLKLTIYWRGRSLARSGKKHGCRAAAIHGRLSAHLEPAPSIELYLLAIGVLHHLAVVVCTHLPFLAQLIAHSAAAQAVILSEGTILQIVIFAGRPGLTSCRTAAGSDSKSSVRFGFLERAVEVRGCVVAEGELVSSSLGESAIQEAHWSYAGNPDLIMIFV